MPITFLLAALALQSMPAPGLARWAPVEAEGVEDVAVDPRSVSRSGNSASLIIRTRIQDLNGIVTAIMRYRYDCAANTVIREAGEMYDPAGNFLGAAGAGDANQPIPPASLQAVLRGVACGPQG